MFKITKSVLFSVLTVASTTTANVFKDNPGRIVGGDTADPGDYPYFVEMGGCGGTLFAPDMVLFAAHCENWKDKQLNIGAYQATTVAEGSQVRYCDEWKQDPKYGTEGSNINYDFALCRLNEPVYIDESNVKLELNDRDFFPQEGKNLIAMGVGALTQGGNAATVLQDVIVPAMTNDECKQYYGNEITDIMLCAGFQEGEKDSCQGDSGGPLVRRKTNDDGSFTDTHVGVVSWGYGCAQANNPGVYARTSKRVDWIEDASCSMGSIADFCDNDPPPAPAPCNDEDLTIKVSTDKFGVETKWTLRDSNNEEIMKRSYLISFYDNEHTLCLKSDECYDFLIEDSYGDGMCYENFCGSYSLVLNGQEITSAVGDFTRSRSFQFCTGGGVGNPPSSSSSSEDSNDFCGDIEEFEFRNDPSKTCENWVGVGKKKKIKKKCRKKWLGFKVFDWCPETCGDVGLGFCAR